MDIVSTLEAAKEIAGWAVIVVPGISFAASLYVARTHTPDPNTVWGKVYRVIEIAAVVSKFTKETGLIPQSGAQKAAEATIGSLEQRLAQKVGA